MCVCVCVCVCVCGVCVCAGFGEGDRAAREEREDREAYRRDCKFTVAFASVGPSAIPPPNSQYLLTFVI